MINNQDSCELNLTPPQKKKQKPNNIHLNIFLLWQHKIGIEEQKHIHIYHTANMHELLRQLWKWQMNFFSIY